MTSFPNSPRVLASGIVTVDPKTAKVLSVVALQYNPDSLTRKIQAQRFGGENPEQGDALRLSGPASETFSFEAEIDAADQLEFPDQNAATVAHGVQPQIAALEALVNPTSRHLLDNDALASSGALEIAPAEMPLALFVWSADRVVPVRVTAFSVTEEAFDIALNPIRAKITMSLTVMNIDDLGFDHTGGKIFMNYLQAKERLAAKLSNPGLSPLGIGGVL